MKAYITKYALTKGIFEAEDATEPEGRYQLITSPSLKPFARILGEGVEWHRTKEAAIARAEEMRVSQIESLKRAIKRLESLVFLGQIGVEKEKLNQ